MVDLPAGTGAYDGCGQVARLTIDDDRWRSRRTTMEKRTPVAGLGLLAIMLLFVACGVAYPTGRAPIVGAGEVVMTTYTLGAINEVELAGPGALLVKQGDSDSLS